MSWAGQLMTWLKVNASRRPSWTFKCAQIDIITSSTWSGRCLRAGMALGTVTVVS